MNKLNMENGYLKYWRVMSKKTFKIFLLTLLLLFFGVCVAFGGEAEDVAKKKGLVDLSPSVPEKGIVFAVCIFAVGEDGTKYLVDHRAAVNMGHCLKEKRKAELKYRDPEHRKLMGGTRFVFACDKVDALVEIQENGDWKILKILGKHKAAYKKKKSYE